jgi:hypothetical protein
MAALDRLMHMLQNHLAPQEIIEQGIYGTYESKTQEKKLSRKGGLFITNYRLIFFRKRFLGLDLEIIPYESITSVEVRKGLLGQILCLQIPGNPITVKRISNGNVKDFIEALQGKIGAQTVISPQPVSGLQGKELSSTKAKPANANQAGCGCLAVLLLVALFCGGIRSCGEDTPPPAKYSAAAQEEIARQLREKHQARMQEQELEQQRQKERAEQQRVAALPLEDQIHELMVQVWGKKMRARNLPCIAHIEKDINAQGAISVHASYPIALQETQQETCQTILSDVVDLLKAALASEHFAKIKAFTFEPYILSLTQQEEQAARILIKRDNIEKLDFDQMDPSVLENVCDIEWLLPVMEVKGLYEIVEVDDTSVNSPIGRLPRVSCKVRLLEPVTEPVFHRIAESVVQEYAQYHVAVFFFYLPDAVIHDNLAKGQFSSPPVGKATWAPHGSVGDGSTVPVGDFSKHKLMIEGGFGKASPWTRMPPVSNTFSIPSQGYMVRIVVRDDTQENKLSSGAQIHFEGYGSWIFGQELKYGNTFKDIGRRPAGRKEEFSLYLESIKGPEIKITFMMTKDMSRSGSARDAIDISIGDEQIEVSGLPIQAATGEFRVNFSR